MNRFDAKVFTVVAALCALATPAGAHAVLETGSAAVGASYKAVMKIGHGCNGSATLKIRIQIPEGYIGVKPMPKPGWTLETVRGPYSKEYQSYHQTLKEGVKEIVWTGRLPDEFYDEFAVVGLLSDELQASSTLYFPTVQECEKGTHRWIEIPEPGKTSRDYKEPAPGLKLLPASK
jgi:uncharacterized protein YcnI